MLAVYLVVLFEIPLFAWISYLPLGEAFCRFLEFMMFFGIWIVPALYIITIFFMILVRKKIKEDSQNKRISVSTIILPICLAALMLLTNFIEILA
jgi:membrane protein insertase Oxa1/YidC/SpoIIIJ